MSDILKDLNPDRPYRGRGREQPYLSDWGDIITHEPTMTSSAALANSPAVRMLRDVSNYKKILRVTNDQRQGHYSGPRDETGERTIQDLEPYITDYTGSGKTSANRAFEDAFRMARASDSGLHSLQQPWGLDMQGIKRYEPHYYDQFSMFRERFGENIKDAETGEKAWPARPDLQYQDHMGIVDDFVSHYSGEHGNEGQVFGMTEPEYTTEYDGFTFDERKELNAEVLRSLLEGHYEYRGDGSTDYFPEFGHYSEPSPRFDTYNRGRPTMNEVEQGVRSILDQHAVGGGDWQQRILPKDLWLENIPRSSLDQLVHNYWDDLQDSISPHEFEDSLSRYHWLHPETNAARHGRSTPNLEDYRGIYEYNAHPNQQSNKGNLARAFLQREDSRRRGDLQSSGMGRFI